MEYLVIGGAIGFYAGVWLAAWSASRNFSLQKEWLQEDAAINAGQFYDDGVNDGFDRGWDAAVEKYVIEPASRNRWGMFG